MRPVALAALLLLSSATPALAWGARGHEWITTVALQNLPPQLPAFLHSPEAIDEMAVLSREPDRWRVAGSEHDAERDPAHYIHLDDQGRVLGALALRDLPPTREAFDTALRALGVNQYQAGYVPYAIIDGWQQLVKDFAYLRADRIGAKTAKTAADRAWFAKDAVQRQHLIIRDLGIWAHYVEDSSNPMHVSTHYMGWGDASNPSGYSNSAGLHWKFEATFVKANLTLDQVRIAPYRDCQCTISARTRDYIGASGALVTALYDIEKKDGFGQAVTPESRAFVLSRLSAGATQLRDMITDAWTTSAGAAIATPAIQVADIESGKITLTKPMFGDE